MASIGSVNGVRISTAEYAVATLSGSDIGAGGFIDDPATYSYYGGTAPSGAYTVGLTNNGVIQVVPGHQGTVVNSYGPGKYLFFFQTVEKNGNSYGGPFYDQYLNSRDTDHGAPVYLRNDSTGLTFLTNTGTIVGNAEIIGIGGPVNVTNSGVMGGIESFGGSYGGTVLNSGVIAGYGYAIEGDFDAVVNTELLSSTATIDAGGAGLASISGTLTNQGTILGGVRAGAVVNSGLITGTGDGVVTSNRVTNLATGTILATGTASYTAIDGGQTSVATIINAGLVSGQQFGINFYEGSLNNLSTGTIAASSGFAVASGGYATLKNAGTIVAVGSHSVTENGQAYLFAGGVYLLGGGTVINQAGALISTQYGTAAEIDDDGTLLNFGTLTTAASGKSGIKLIGDGSIVNGANAIIQGGQYGVFSEFGQASISNAGTIAAGSTIAGSTVASVGIDLSTVTASSYVTTATFSSYVTNAAMGTIIGTTGIADTSGPGAVVNAGSILGGGAGGVGITLSAGGEVDNQGLITTATTLANTGNLAQANGVVISGATGTVSNAGSIYGHNLGIDLAAGGVIKNQVGGIVSFNTTLAGASYAAVVVGGTVASTIVNAGTLGSAVALSLGYGVAASDGLYLTNLATGTIGGGSGISVKQGLSTVINAGLIQGDGTLGTQFTANGTYSVGTLGSIGIYGGGGLTLANAAAGTITGGNGVFIRNASGIITNAGLIAGNNYSAVAVFGTNNSSFYLDNTSGGTIAYNISMATGSSGKAIEVRYSSSTVVNSGFIEGQILLRGGGVVTNNAGGSAGFIESRGTQAITVTNAGTLQGFGAGYGVAKFDNMANGIVDGVGIVNGSLTNAGTITIDPGADFNRAVIKAGSEQYQASLVYINNSSSGLIIATGTTGDGIIDDNSSTGVSRVILTNSGTIIAPLALIMDGYVHNAAGALISGKIEGANNSNLTLVNAGTITADGTSGGLLSNTLINQAGGKVLAPVGLLLDGTGAGGAETVVNAGIIGDAANPGVAIALWAGSNHLLEVEPGAQFYGSVNGSAPFGNLPAGSSTNTIELTAGTGRLAGFGGQITNFNSVVFDAGAAWTIEGSGIGLAASVISGFASGDMIDIDGFVSQNSSFSNGYLNLTSASSGHVALNLGGNFTTASFIISSDGAGGTDVAVACFRTGTHIATPAGQTLVEDLSIGDDVLTASGEARPIKWIGKRGYMPRVVAANKKTQPILFRAGSLADGIPCRDLFVSAQHAMFLDGVLVPAASLVNGSSIVRAASPGAILYLHIELETHDVILAEGAPAETFIDDDSRGIFHNAAEFAKLYPDAPPSAGFCAPRVEDGYKLEEIRIRLASRARDLAGAVAA